MDCRLRFTQKIKIKNYTGKEERGTTKKCGQLAAVFRASEYKKRKKAEKITGKKKEGCARAQQANGMRSMSGSERACDRLPSHSLTFHSLAKSVNFELYGALLCEVFSLSLTQLVNDTNHTK